MNKVPLSKVILSAQAGIACGQRDDRGIAQLRLNNLMTNGNVDFAGHIRIPSSLVSDDMLLLVGDVLFNNTNSVELVGKTAYFEGHYEEITFSNHITRIRVKRNELDPEYLAFWLQHQWRSKVFEGMCDRWIGQAAVQRNKLESLEMPIPSAKAQRRIAAHLKAQLTEVETARQAAQVQYREARALGRSLQEAAFAALLADHSRDRCLKNVCDISAGGTPNRGNRTFFSGDIPWVKTLDLNFGVVMSTEEKISGEAFRAIRGELLPVGTVMVAMYGGAGTIGKSGILGIEACTNQAVCALQPDRNVLSPEFLHEWICCIRPEWMRYSGGNRKDPNINKSTVEEMTLPLPSLDTQCRFVKSLKSRLLEADVIRQKAITRLTEIENLPQRLLAQAFGDTV